MKKILCMLLAVLLLASLGAAAFADGYRTDFQENGFTLTYTDEFDNLKGVFEPYPYGMIDDGIFYAPFFYIALSDEELSVLMEKEDLTEDDLALVTGNQGTLAVVYAFDFPKMSEENAAILENEMMDKLTELARVGDVVFYLQSMKDADETTALLERLTPEFREEFLTLQNAFEEVLKNAEYYAPVIPGADLLGTVVSFETTDVDGNPVKSSEIFAEHEVTMINIWTTWCTNCMHEMAGLNEMNQRLAEKNAAVIGICQDADTELEECKNVIAEYGVEFLNLVPSDDLVDFLDVSGFPTSYFVDSEGRILTLPVKGAPMEMSYYEDIIGGLLRGEAVETEPAGDVTVTDNGVYRVIVGDEDGNLVKGATVQFCSDTTCMMGKTDENGVAVFQMEEGPVYTIHMLKVPEGYQKTSEEFKTADSYCDVYIVLQKAA